MHPPSWSTLDHAYGPATDIPGLLDRARRASAPASYRDEPWFGLWSALCHQGDVFSASYAAVPSLIDIAEARSSEPRVAAECLYMAASIELERGAPVGTKPQPALPAPLADTYLHALTRVAELTAQVRERQLGSDAREMLEVAAAVFSGDLVRARLLVDGPDEDE